MALKMLGGNVPMPNPYDIVLSTTPAMGGVTVTKGKQGTIVKDESIVVHPGIAVPPDKLCTVGAAAAHTINIGNYESVKVSAFLSMPSSKEDINATYEFVSSWVSDRITEAAKSFKE